MLLLPSALSAPSKPTKLRAFLSDRSNTSLDCPYRRKLLYYPLRTTRHWSKLDPHHLRIPRPRPRPRTHGRRVRLRWNSLVRRCRLPVHALEHGERRPLLREDCLAQPALRRLQARRCLRARHLRRDGSGLRGHPRCHPALCRRHVLPRAHRAPHLPRDAATRYRTSGQGLRHLGRKFYQRLGHRGGRKALQHPREPSPLGERKSLGRPRHRRTMPASPHPTPSSATRSTMPPCLPSHAAKLASPVPSRSIRRSISSRAALPKAGPSTTPRRSRLNQSSSAFAT
jgi:hypothetical protein